MFLFSNTHVLHMNIFSYTIHTCVLLLLWGHLIDSSKCYLPIPKLYPWRNFSVWTLCFCVQVTKRDKQLCWSSIEWESSTRQLQCNSYSYLHAYEVFPPEMFVFATDRLRLGIVKEHNGSEPSRNTVLLKAKILLNHCVESHQTSLTKTMNSFYLKFYIKILNSNSTDKTHQHFQYTSKHQCWFGWNKLSIHTVTWKHQERHEI